MMGLVGDTVKVYFKFSPNVSEPNLNLFQIERGNVVLFDNKEFRKREGKGLIVATVGLIVMLIFGIIQDKRLRLGKI